MQMSVLHNFTFLEKNGTILEIVNMLFPNEFHLKIPRL